MKRIFYSVIVAALGTLMFSSCSNDDVVGADKTADYQSNFEKVFGQVSPGQNFNTQKTLTIESSVTDMQGNYTLRVYDGVPSRKGSSLLGKFENLSASGTSTVQVGVSKTTKHIYCIADNGEVRQSLSAQVASKKQVTAKFDAADGAPTEAPAYSDDQLSTVTIAFEDLGSTDDFDFNDAVVKVEYATGTGKANVTLMAVGAVLPLKLYYVGGRQALPLFGGQELHAAMGYDQDMMINTNRKAQGKNDGVDNVAFVTCEIDVPDDFTIGEDGAPFLLEVDGVQEQRQITASTEYGAIPQVLVTGKYYDEQTRTSYLWRWPKERVRLNLAFPTVSDWMSDPTNLTFLAAGAESNLYDGYDPTVVDVISVPTEGLVAYYPFNGNANDESGYGNHGTPTSAVVLATGVHGDSDGAYQFGGPENPGHIYVPNSQSLQFTDGATFSVYVKPTSWTSMDGWGSTVGSGGSQCIFAKDHDRGGVCFCLDGNDERVGIGSGGFYQDWASLNTHEQLTGQYLNKWTHVAYVFGDGYARLYVNGQLIDEKESTPDFSWMNELDLYIGKFSDYWYPFNGLIDEVRIYNRALTAEEVMALYQEPLN